MKHKAEILMCEVVTVSPDSTISEVAELLKRRRIGCVVVEDQQKIVGIFSERDIVTRILPAGVSIKKAKVREHMTPDPATVEASEPLEKVFALLARQRFRHVPITLGGRPVGIVSLTDFAGVLREVFSEEKYVQYFVDYFKSKN